MVVVAGAWSIKGKEEELILRKNNEEEYLKKRKTKEIKCLQPFCFLIVFKNVLMQLLLVSNSEN